MLGREEQWRSRVRVEPPANNISVRSVGRLAESNFLGQRGLRLELDALPLVDVQGEDEVQLGA
jgi:hypothetical protein